MKDELLFDENFFVSKSIKQIDSSVGYNGDMEHKLIKNLVDCNKDRTKELSSIQIENMKIRRRNKEIELKKHSSIKFNFISF